MQKHLLTDGVREVYLEYPAGWDEMDRKQAKYAGELLFMLEAGKIDVDQFRKLMVDRFINRDNSGNDKIKNIDRAMNMWGNEGELADTVNFFFKITKTKEGKEAYEVLPTGTINHFATLLTGFRKYKGPGEFLHGITFLQFKDALAMSQKYMETRKPEYLTRLLTVLYTRRGETYTPEAADRRIKRFNRVGIGIKQMVFYYLMGCMHQLRTDGGGEGIEVDGNVCRFSKIFTGGGGGGEGIGLTGVLMSLAESGVFGNIKETANADVWDVLVRLYQLDLQRREMEKAMKKNN